MARPPYKPDPHRGPDPSVDPSAPVGHRGPETQDPKRGPDPNSPYTSDQTVRINGQDVPTGYTEYGFDDKGNPTVRWVPYTRQELEKAAADKARAAQPGVPHRGPSPTNPKASAPTKNPGGPNFNQSTATPSAFDNFASGTTGSDYSKSNVVTEYGQNLHLSSRADDGALNAKSSSLEDLLREFTNSGKANIAKVQQELIDARLGQGITVTGLPEANTLAAYRGLLQNVLVAQSAGQQITPDELLAGLSKSAPKNTTQTSTDSRVALTNPVQARQALVTAFSDKLGRRPSDAETAAFTQALNAYESSNPSVTTTNTDLATAADGSQTVKSQNTSETDKGTSSLNFVNDYATNYAQTNPQTAPEYHAAQALNFYNLALSTLAGGISTGNTT